MRIVCDESKCIGCLACVVACLDRRYESAMPGDVSPRLHERKVRPAGTELYLTDSCRHCKNAPCIGVCPMEAIGRDEHGFVVLDEDKCIGCGACKGACPWHIPRKGRGGVYVKCNGCGGEEPACVAVCPMDALSLK